MGRQPHPGIGSNSPNLFSEHLARFLPGWDVVNEGRSGQTAAEVVARQGGAPSGFTVADDVIPSSGPVEVTAATVRILSANFEPRTEGAAAGELAGVPGLYVVERGGRQTFTRARPGEEAACPPGTPFFTANGADSRADVMFLSVGENGVQNTAPQTLLAYTQAAVSYLAPERRRFVVASVTPRYTATSGSDSRRAYDRLNALLASTWGADHLDLATPPTDAEMAAIGFTPDAGGRADIAAGVYPRGMFQDTIHLLSAGQQLWALRLNAHLRRRGHA